MGKYLKIHGKKAGRALWLTMMTLYSPFLIVIAIAGPLGFFEKMNPGGLPTTKSIANSIFMTVAALVLFIGFGWCMTQLLGRLFAHFYNKSLEEPKEDSNE